MVSPIQSVEFFSGGEGPTLIEHDVLRRSCGERSTTILGLKGQEGLEARWFFDKELGWPSWAGIYLLQTRHKGNQFNPTYLVQTFPVREGGQFVQRLIRGELPENFDAPFVSFRASGGSFINENTLGFHPGEIFVSDFTEPLIYIQLKLSGQEALKIKLYDKGILFDTIDWYPTQDQRYFPISPGRFITRVEVAGAHFQLLEMNYAAAFAEINPQKWRLVREITPPDRSLALALDPALQNQPELALTEELLDQVGGGRVFSDEELQEISETNEQDRDAQSGQYVDGLGMLLVSALDPKNAETLGLLQKEIRLENNLFVGVMIEAIWDRDERPYKHSLSYIMDPFIPRFDEALPDLGVLKIENFTSSLSLSSLNESPEDLPLDEDFEFSSEDSDIPEEQLARYTNPQDLITAYGMHSDEAPQQVEHDMRTACFFFHSRQPLRSGDPVLATLHVNDDADYFADRVISQKFLELGPDQTIPLIQDAQLSEIIPDLVYEFDFGEYELQLSSKDIFGRRSPVTNKAIIDIGPKKVMVPNPQNNQLIVGTGQDALMGVATLRSHGQFTLIGFLTQPEDITLWNQAFGAEDGGAIRITDVDGVSNNPHGITGEDFKREALPDGRHKITVTLKYSGTLPQNHQKIEVNFRVRVDDTGFKTPYPAGIDWETTAGPQLRLNILPALVSAPPDRGPILDVLPPDANGKVVVKVSAPDPNQLVYVYRTAVSESNSAVATAAQENALLSRGEATTIYQDVLTENGRGVVEYRVRYATPDGVMSPAFSGSSRLRMLGRPLVARILSATVNTEAPNQKINLKISVPQSRAGTTEQKVQIYSVKTEFGDPLTHTAGLSPVAELVTKGVSASGHQWVRWNDDYEVDTIIATDLVVDSSERIYAVRVLETVNTIYADRSLEVYSKLSKPSGPIAPLLTLTPEPLALQFNWLAADQLRISWEPIEGQNLYLKLSKDINSPLFPITEDLTEAQDYVLSDVTQGWSLLAVTDLNGVTYKKNYTDRSSEVPQNPHLGTN